MTNEMFKKEAFKKSVKDNVKFLYRKTIEEATHTVSLSLCRVESICLLAAVNSSIVYFMFSPLTSDFFVKSEYTTELCRQL